MPTWYGDGYTSATRAGASLSMRPISSDSRVWMRRLVALESMGRRSIARFLHSAAGSARLEQCYGICVKLGTKLAAAEPANSDDRNALIFDWNAEGDQELAGLSVT